MEEYRDLETEREKLFHSLRKRIGDERIVEAMTLPLPETPSGALRSDAVAKILSSHERRAYTVMALGPGIGIRSESQKAVVGVLGSLKIPAVIDADGLNVLSMVSRKETALAVITVSL